ncbi:MAG: integrase arm-type DNA-binding domain-containing protein [Desulfovibrio sp.]|nr:integrase arm-type DNA-binding domain-containing protein [Desulfovibrio sp.]
MAGSLSDKQIKALVPKEKTYITSDGYGMYLEVTPKGSKRWRMKYRFGGKENRLSFGLYPDVTLAQAREKCQEVRKMISEGTDPSQARKDAKAQAKAEAERQGRTLKLVALEWYDKKTLNRVPRYRKQILSQLLNYVFPVIGNCIIDEIKRVNLVECVKKVEEKGYVDLAHRIAVIIGQIWRYAFSCGYIDYDLTFRLGDVLETVKKKQMPAIEDKKEIGELLRKIDTYDGTVNIRYALRIMPYVFVRSEELCGAYWKEVDLEKGIWIIPAERMKKRKEHIVPLAKQVVSMLSELYKYTGSNDFIFPSNARSGHIITDSLVRALRWLGYSKQKMCVHGFRSIASSNLNEMGFRPDVIEIQLSHAQKDSVRAAYNRAQYLEERREMMQKYADYLDSLRAQA